MTADRRDILEREIVLCRVIDAPIERVFGAWADPAQITKWFGPEGFTCDTSECDIREGGRWRFVYTGPDGTKWTNRIDYLRIEPPHLIEMHHGSDTEDDPNRFHVLVTFDAQANSKTVITMRQLHPSAERRTAVIGFGAVEYGYQTLDKLAKHLSAR
jgi:uncharacterized protein YndB with AHSA1/START domain